jgi:hypothetical protein
MRHRWRVDPGLNGQLHLVKACGDDVVACSLAGEVLVIGADGVNSPFVHAEPVLDIDLVTLEGRRIALIATPSGAALVDMTTGHVLHFLDGHVGQATRVSFFHGTYDHVQAVSTDESGWLQVWTMDGQRQTRLQLHRKSLHTLVMAKADHGEPLALTSSDDRIVRLSRLTAPWSNCIELSEHVDWIEDAVCAGPDGAVDFVLTIDRRYVTLSSISEGASSIIEQTTNDQVMCSSAAWLRVDDAPGRPFFATGHRSGVVWSFGADGAKRSVLEFAGPVVAVHAYQHVTTRTASVVAGALDGQVRQWSDRDAEGHGVNLASPVAHLAMWPADVGLALASTADGVLHALEMT